MYINIYFFLSTAFACHWLSSTLLTSSECNSIFELVNSFANELQLKINFTWRYWFLPVYLKFLRFFRTNRQSITTESDNEALKSLPPSSDERSQHHSVVLGNKNNRNRAYQLMAILNKCVDGSLSRLHGWLSLRTKPSKIEFDEFGDVTFFLAVPMGLLFPFELKHSPSLSRPS